MPELDAKPVGALLVEIISPSRRSSRDTLLCDCCRRWKMTCEFDEDCFGICAECLGCDGVLVGLSAGMRTEPQPNVRKKR